MTRKTTPYGRRLARLRARGVDMARDGISMTRMLNTPLKPSEIASVLNACKAALQAMREARGSFADWLTLCTAHHVSVAIEDGGVIRGQRDILNDADAALDAIGARCGRHTDQWTPRACTGPELSALADLIPAHSRQLHILTYGEYIKCADKAVARVETRRGQVFRIAAGAAPSPGATA